MKDLMELSECVPGVPVGGGRMWGEAVEFRIGGQDIVEDSDGDDMD